ncbi:uncharacterized protein LOC129592734 [Paramacrobiotus metropolitanus]|uniref:uncharacterized protein LOC129592734 n=1 Tax=Paramacrobiotus metropolitanus TaxID=2943436 RepID=UPI00244602EF|nr:uncharacterized protein LOC129592734 [Paramacrobiotus metropolitanus]
MLVSWTVFMGCASVLCAMAPHGWKERIDPTVLTERESERAITNNSTNCDMVPVNNVMYTGKLKPWNKWNRAWSIPYDIAPFFLRNGDYKLIEWALQRIANWTKTGSHACITFKRRAGERDYIYFQPDSRDNACQSPVGRQCGQQTIRLGRDCMTHGIIQHETLHALGLFHEQNRKDRDAYVEIFVDNILDGAIARNFAIMEDMEYHGTFYDLESIMHYGVYDFAKTPSEPTIIPKSGKNQRQGQRKGLSNGDIAKVRNLYECRAYEDAEATTKDPSKQPLPGLFRLEPITQVEMELPFPPHCISIKGPKNGTPCNDFQGLDVFYTTDVKRQPLKALNNAIKANASHRALKFFLTDGDHMARDVFDPVRLQVVVLCLTDCRGSHTTTRVSRLFLDNLLDYQLFMCNDLVIKKRDFSNMKLLRMIRFRQSTVSSLEVGTFSDLLPNLQVLSLEYLFNENTMMLDDKDYLRKIHCTCEFAWFRRWLTQNQRLLEARAEGSVYGLPQSWQSEAVAKEELYVPVDCNDLDNILFSQIPFSFNEDKTCR